MTALKLGRLDEDRPVKISVELPASVHRDLVRYGEILAQDMGEQTPIDAARLVGPMLMRFMATDRGFTKRRHARPSLAV